MHSKNQPNIVNIPHKGWIIKGSQDKCMKQKLTERKEKDGKGQ